MKKISIVYPKKLGTIAPEIYGHFSEHIGGVFYDGLWVGRDSDIPDINGFRKEAIEKLRAINIPVLRWPGGCYAEVYNWRDGIGENRPVRINWWTMNDKRYEPNHVGTHEFVELCELIGAKPYFAVNVTSATPRDAWEWMDYCLSPRGATTLALEREKNGHTEISLDVLGANVSANTTARILRCDNIRACNTFEEPHKIVPVDAEFDISAPITLPAASVVAISAELK